MQRKDYYIKLLIAISVVISIFSGDKTVGEEKKHFHFNPELKAKLLRWESTAPSYLKEKIVQLRYSNDSAQKANIAVKIGKNNQRDKGAILVLIETFPDNRVLEWVTVYTSGSKMPLGSRTSASEQASGALARIGTPSVEPLIELLEHGEPCHKKASAEALSAMKECRATELLIKLLKDEHVSVRESALKALNTIDPNWAESESSKKLGLYLLKDLKEGKYVPATSIETLGFIGNRRAVDPLIEILKKGRQPNDKRRIRSCVAAEALGRIGDPQAIEALIEVLGSRLFIESSSAALALGEIGDERAVQPLIDALKSLNTRNEAIEALGRIGDCRAVGPLIDVLKSSRRKDETIEALGRIGDKRAIKPLIEILKETNVRLRYKIESALVKIGESAVEALIVLLKFKNEDVRRRAANALGRIKDHRAVKPLIESIINNEVGDFYPLGDALVNIGVPATEPLIETLKDENLYVRMLAAEILGKIENTNVVAPLIKALKDKDVKVQIKAAEALGRIKDPRAIEPLIELLERERWIVGEKDKEAAARALGEIGDNRAVDALLKAWEKAGTWLCIYIADALGCIGDERAVEVLIKGLEHYDTGVREHSAIALGGINNIKAVEPLIRSIDGRYQNFRGGMEKALVKIGEPSVSPLVKAFKQKKSNWIYMGILEQIGEPSVESLISILRDRSVDPSDRGQVAKALGRIGDHRACGPLMEVLKDKVNLGHYAFGALDTLAPYWTETEQAKMLAPYFIEKLSDENKYVRLDGAKGLVFVLDVRAVNPLIKALKDDYEEVRKEAADALGEMREHRAIPVLIGLMKDENIKLRITRVLEQITEIHLGTDYEKWQDWIDKRESQNLKSQF